MSASDVNILFGGTSNERRVSVASGQNVAGALVDAKAWFLALNGAVFEVGFPPEEQRFSSRTEIFCNWLAD